MRIARGGARATASANDTFILARLRARGWLENFANWCARFVDAPCDALRPDACGRGRRRRPAAPAGRGRAARRHRRIRRGTPPRARQQPPADARVERELSEAPASRRLLYCRASSTALGSKPTGVPTSVLHAIDATPRPVASRAGGQGAPHRRARVTTVGELRDEAARARGLATCRLVYKGDLTRDPSRAKLEATKLRPGAKCAVMRARR